MNPFTVGALITGGLGLVGNILGFRQEKKQADQNYNLGLENLAYQKDLQQQIFQREDNAVQRRVEDLQKAGLSKTLAAGSAAGAGAVVNTQAPEKKQSFDRLAKMFDTQQMLMNTINIKKANADVNATNAQAELIKQQAENAKTEKLEKLQNIKLKEQEYGFLSEWNPLRKEQLSMEIAQSKLINPLVIEDKKKEIEIKTANLSLKEQEKLLNEVRLQAERLGVKQKEVEITSAKLKNEYDNASMEARLNAVQKELLILDLTIESKKIANDMEQKEKAFYENFPVPRSVVEGVGGASSRILDSAVKALLK